MRFKGTPGLHVVDAETGRQVGVFDGKGYMEVADEAMAARMKRVFNISEPRKKRAVPEGKEVK